MTQHLTLFFEPLDVLHFRDHKPFDAGVHVSADSVFPMPSVFYGCIRTALLRDAGARFDRDDEHFGVEAPWARVLLGGPRTQGALAMRGPLLARWEPRGPAPLFPLPRDLVVTERDDGAVKEVPRTWRAQVLAPRPFEGPHAPRRLHGESGRISPVNEALPWTAAEVEKGLPDLLLTRAGAQVYFEAGGDGPVLREGEHAVPSASVFEKEPRVGIARDPETHAAEDRMLYMKRPFRLAEGHGFAVDVEVSGKEAREALGALAGRVVPLGGKGHRARVRVAEGALIPSALDPSATNGGKLWLLSPLPLPLRDGTRPALVVTDKPALVGGYDMAKRAPKALRRALPAGTVLHLGEGQTLGALFANDDDRRMGYGTALGRGRK
jgi:CRISPR-associated protein Cmr3